MPMAQKNKTQSKVRKPKSVATNATKKASAKTVKSATASKPKAPKKPAAPAAKAAAKVAAPAKAVAKAAAKAPAKPVASVSAKAKAAPAAAVAKKVVAKPAAKADAVAPAKTIAPAKAAAPVKAAAVAAAHVKGKPVAQRAVAAVVSAPATAKISAPAAPAKSAAKPAEKKAGHRHGFKPNEYVVYPAHGVGRIIGIEEQEIAGHSLELFVITFEKEKLTLRVPTGKLESVGMRKLSDGDTVRKAMDTLKGRARIKRTMWSRRAQEYVAKINSGSLISIAEVVRDLYRSEAQPEQSYSERQLYEDALDRMAREIAAVDKLDERGAVQRITEVLSKSARGRRATAEAEEAEAA